MKPCETVTVIKDDQIKLTRLDLISASVLHNMIFSELNSFCVCGWVCVPVNLCVYVCACVCIHSCMRACALPSVYQGSALCVKSPGGQPMPAEDPDTTGEMVSSRYPCSNAGQTQSPDIHCDWLVGQHSDVAGEALP